MNKIGLKRFMMKITFLKYKYIFYLKCDVPGLGLTDEDVGLLRGWACDTPAQGLIGLIGYSYQQVAISFPEAGLQRTPRLSVLGPEKFGDGWPTGKFFSGAHEWGQSVQKRLVLVCEDSYVLESSQI